MQIKNEKPPILDKILAAGMHPNLESTIFTYGDTIYNPSGRPIPDYLLAHEATHFKQQIDPAAWWDQYLKDKEFRFDQEAEAYANQYKFMCKKVKDRNMRFRILYELAGALSGPTYGNMTTQSEALNIIKQKAK